MALIRIRENEIVDQFQCYINTGTDIPANVEGKAGIADSMVVRQEISEDAAFEKISKFIGNDLVVG